MWKNWERLRATTVSRRLCGLALWTAYLIFSLLVAFHHQGELWMSSAPFAEHPKPEITAEAPLYQARFVSHGLTRLVHSAAAVQRPDGVIQAFWFGGSWEGHRDVRIFTAVYDPDRQRWSEEAPLMTRQATQAGGHRYISKLGNPVAVVDLRGRIRLFYVSVSFGGWSGSSINSTLSDDNGRTWTSPRPLVTSPFLNLSTLVKGPPVLHADGSLGLPVYHELLGKFSEYLRLDDQSRVLGKSRISHGRVAIQPVIFPEDDYDSVALMRNTDEGHPHRAWTSRTADAGQTWTQPIRSDILNKDSALARLVVGPELFLGATNVSDGNRSVLSLLRSRDQGQTWSLVHDVEPYRAPLPPRQFLEEVGREVAASKDNTSLDPNFIADAAVETQCEPGHAHCDFRFDYPWLLQDNCGRFHLLYSWNRAFIRHVTFNAAWLEGRPDQPLNAQTLWEARP